MRSKKPTKRPAEAGLFFFRAPSSGNSILLEPGEHPLTAVFGGFPAVARAVISVEGVRHAFVDVDHRLLVLAEGEERRAQALDRIEGNTLVGSAVEAEHRGVQFVRDVDRRERLRGRVRIE